MTAAASPTRIVDLAVAYMGAQQLISSARIGLFTALTEGPLDAAALAEATARSEHQVRILADSMTAHGLLERTEGAYALSDDARAYLTGDAAELDLTPFLSFLGTVSYDQWRGYQHTVDTDDAGTLELDEDGWGGFMAGVMAYNDLHAQQFARELDLSGFRDVLDLGTLSPSFAVNLLQANPEARVELQVDPQAAPSFAAALEQAGLGERATVTPVETTEAAPTGEHDLVMVNHVLHRFSAEQNAGILSAARRAAAPGATLYVLDFYLDEEGTPRRLDAVHAGEYYNIDGTFVYPLAQVRGWLEGCGWRFEELVALPGSPRLLVATAV